MFDPTQLSDDELFNKKNDFLARKSWLMFAGQGGNMVEQIDYYIQSIELEQLERHNKKLLEKYRKQIETPVNSDSGPQVVEASSDKKEKTSKHPQLTMTRTSKPTNK